jgi:DnaK suppressor protein
MKVLNVYSPIVRHGMRCVGSHSMIKTTMHSNNTPITGQGAVQRYSVEELAEFEAIIQAKLDVAKEDLHMSVGSIARQGSNGTEDTYAGNRGLDEGNPSLEREELMMLAIRQQKFILELNLALGRIRLGTYGVCRISGARIPKERLRIVPHATLSMNVKLEQTART